MDGLQEQSVVDVLVVVQYLNAAPIHGVVVAPACSASAKLAQSPDSTARRFSRSH